MKQNFYLGGNMDLKTKMEVLPCGMCEDMISCDNCLCQKEAKELYNEIYNQALEDFYNGLADELLWIKERFGDDAYTDAWCSVGCLQNRLTKYFKEPE